MLSGRVFQQIVGIPMRTNCTLLLPDLFIYSGLLKKNEKGRRRVQFVLIGMPTICWKTRPESIANVFSMKNSSMLIISVSENFLVEPEWLFTK
jgi:hypothetical protein